MVAAVFFRNPVFERDFRLPTSLLTIKGALGYPQKAHSVTHKRRTRNKSSKLPKNGSGQMKVMCGLSLRHL